MASFNSQAFDRFPLGSYVRIDGKGKAEVVKLKQETLNGPKYTVRLDGIDFEADIPSSRLSAYNENVSSVVTPVENQATRFLHINDSDIDDFVNEQSNRNTLSKTFYDMKLLKKFMTTPEMKEIREIHEIPPEDLSPLLCKFFIGVRKADGSQYEPNSLRGFLCSFDRHLRRFSYGYSLHNSVQFAKVQDVLKSKQKELKRCGMGNMPNKAEVVTESDIDTFWNTKQFGLATPDSIINTLWFYNTVHFGLRGSDEHRSMCWGDVILREDSNKQEYLEFTERQTKTRTGSNPRDVRPVKPKMWANENADRCPVAVYKHYSLLRPTDYCKPSDPFYIATHTKQPMMQPGDQSFKKQPIGINKLTSLMSRMANAAGLPAGKKLSNHSARKHLVQKLSENNVPPTQIMQITGHKNVQSINNYSHINDRQHKEISNILSNTGSNVSNVPNSTCSMPSLSQYNVSNYRSETSKNAPNIQDSLTSMFSGNIFGGTFNIHVHNENHSPVVPKKCRKITIDREESDKDSD